MSYSEVTGRQEFWGDTTKLTTCINPKDEHFKTITRFEGFCDTPIRHPFVNKRPTGCAVGRQSSNARNPLWELPLVKRVTLPKIPWAAHILWWINMGERDKDPTLFHLLSIVLNGNDVFIILCSQPRFHWDCIVSWHLHLHNAFLLFYSSLLLPGASLSPSSRAFSYIPPVHWTLSQILLPGEFYLLYQIWIHNIYESFTK